MCMKRRLQPPQVHIQQQGSCRVHTRSSRAQRMIKEIDLNRDLLPPERVLRRGMEHRKRRV